jgi:hypothetical protein
MPVGDSMDNSAKHPSDDDILNFASNEPLQVLSQLRREEIEEHLESCDLCLALIGTVEHIDRVTEDFKAGRLPSLSPIQEEMAEKVRVRVLETLKLSGEIR